MWSDRTPRARGEQIWVVNSTLLNSQHKTETIRFGKLAVSVELHHVALIVVVA